MKKIIITGIILFSYLLFSFCASAQVLTDTVDELDKKKELVKEEILYKKDENVEKVYNHIQKIDNYLSKNEIIGFSKYHLKSYLKNEINGQNVIVGEELIPLYDNENNLINWFVPFLNKEKEVVGHVIIGSNLDTYSFYALIESPQDFNQARNLYRNGKQLIFVPLSDFIYKDNGVYYNKYGKKLFEDHSANSFFRSLSSSEILEEELSKNLFEKEYYHLRKYDTIKENRNTNLKLLKMLDFENELEAKERPSIVDCYEIYNPQKRAAIVDVRIQEEYFSKPSFLNIDGKYYGGDQNWWQNENLNWKNQGCGAVAAANLTAYYAKYFPSKAKKLYNGSMNNITKDQFKTHMTNIIKTYIKPGSNWPFPGVLPVDFVNGMIAYAHGKGVTMTANYSTSNYDFWEASNFIQKVLRANKPVAICMYGSNFSQVDRYEWHWMTVTKYYQDAADTRWVAISTWGGRESVNWRLLHNHSGILKGVGAFIYSFNF